MVELRGEVLLLLMVVLLMRHLVQTGAGCVMLLMRIRVIIPIGVGGCVSIWCHLHDAGLLLLLVMLHMGLHMMRIKRVLMLMVRMVEVLQLRVMMSHSFGRTWRRTGQHMDLN